MLKTVVTNVSVKRIETGFLVENDFEERDGVKVENYRSVTWAFDTKDKALDKVAELIDNLEAE